VLRGRGRTHAAGKVAWAACVYRLNPQPGADIRHGCLDRRESGSLTETRDTAPMATRFDIVKLRRLTILNAAIGLLSVVMPMLQPAPASRFSDICHLNASGDPVIDKVAVGRVSHITNSYFIQEAGDNATLLSRCVKGGCGPLDPRLFESRVGSPVRAEFCGAHPVRVTISGAEVFRLTQQYLDGRVAVTRRRSTWMTRFGAFWCGFWLLLQTIAEIRFKRLNP
jgi:hypothetical protein